MTHRAKVAVSATVSHVIVRGCVSCGHSRTVGEPCAGCGLTDPPVVHDLGVQSCWHANPVKRAWWALFGQHLAARRARLAARTFTDRAAP